MPIDRSEGVTNPDAGYSLPNRLLTSVYVCGKAAVQFNHLMNYSGVRCILEDVAVDRPYSR